MTGDWYYPLAALWIGLAAGLLLLPREYHWARIGLPTMAALTVVYVAYALVRRYG